MTLCLWCKCTRHQKHGTQQQTKSSYKNVIWRVSFLRFNSKLSVKFIWPILQCVLLSIVFCCSSLLLNVTASMLQQQGMQVLQLAKIHVVVVWHLAELLTLVKWIKLFSLKIILGPIFLPSGNLFFSLEHGNKAPV